MADPNDENQLANRILNWLRGEGYPLEYRAASAFRTAGFDVLQGEYVDVVDDGDTKPREVDVIANLRAKLDDQDCLIRAEMLVECKSGQTRKPWLLFCDGHSLHPTAAISQTISSRVGQALLHAASDSDTLRASSLYRENPRTAFMAREAFASGRDTVFDAMRGLVQKTAALMTIYDDIPHWAHGRFGLLGGIGFPVLTTDCPIFEVFDTHGELEVEKVTSGRLAWRGANRVGYSTVDVVQSDYLTEFARDRSDAIRILLAVLSPLVDGLVEDLSSDHASRGAHEPKTLLDFHRHQIQQIPGIERFLDQASRRPRST